MSVPRSFGVFSIVFAAAYAIVYLICVEKNLALFSYHPALNQFGAGVQEPMDGPVMYWYGWIATSTITATLAGLTACVLPASLAQRVWLGWAWFVPAVVMVVFVYLLRNYFL